jgi:hypothetical protein
MGKMYQITKISQITKNIPNAHKLYQMNIKRSNGHKIIPTSSIARPSNLTHIGIFFV